MTLTLTFLGNTAAAPGAAAPIPTPAALVDALNNTFGRHEGKRASHAKGFCAAGEFTPSPDAARIVHSPLFAQGPLPATLRFSVGGGNPNVSDKSRTVPGVPTDRPPMTASKNFRGWPVSSRNSFGVASIGAVSRPSNVVSFLAVAS